MLDPHQVTRPSDLPDGLVLASESDQTVRITTPRQFGFDFHWLREIASGVLEGDLGLRVDPEAHATAEFTLTGSLRTLVSLDEQNWLRFVISKKRESQFRFAAQAKVAAQVAAPPPGILDNLARAILGTHPAQVIRQVTAVLDTANSQVLPNVLRLRDQIYAKAAEALERKLSAELSCRYQAVTQDEALLDCSFDFTEAGLAAYRQALDGDYSAIFAGDSPHIRVRQGVLTHGLSRQTTVELHLPFLGRKEWLSRVDALAKMQVESDGDGRLLVYHVDAASRVACKNSYQSTLALAAGLSLGRVHSASSFTLGYSDTRRLPAARASSTLEPALNGYGFDSSVRDWLNQTAAGSKNSLEASLSLKVPGSLVAAWLDAPGEGNPAFFEVYSRVSVAVQRALRRWLPLVYFKNPGRYETLASAFPLLVYAASRPFNGKPKNDLTYDVMSQDWQEPVYRSARAGLQQSLRPVYHLLKAVAGKSVARFYSPKSAKDMVDSVARQPRLLASLLAADALFVDALVNLGCRGSKLRQELSTEPEKAVRDLAGFSADLVTTFHGKLRRLYGGEDFLPLGSLLLIEATHALQGGSSGAQGIQAVLHVTADGIDQTFVNPAYIP